MHDGVVGSDPAPPHGVGEGPQPPPATLGLWGFPCSPGHRKLPPAGDGREEVGRRAAVGAVRLCGGLQWPHEEI